MSTFAIVVFAFHIQEHKKGLKVSNYVYVVASLLAVVSTIVIVVKTHSLDAEKDRLAKAATDAASLQVAQANRSAAEANRKAQEAHDDAEKVAKENLKLGGQVSIDAASARTAEAALAKANKETSDFAHSLQQQQVTMQEQAKVSPVLTDFQIHQLVASLSPYVGQEVIIHRTTDTVVGRLAATIATSLQMAGLKFPEYSNDIGALYQGVSVAVHDPNNVPPLANALVAGLRQAGIDVHPVAAPQQVPEGKVAIYLGPN